MGPRKSSNVVTFRAVYFEKANQETIFEKKVECDNNIRDKKSGSTEIWPIRRSLRLYGFSCGQPRHVSFDHVITGV